MRFILLLCGAACTLAMLGLTGCQLESVEPRDNKLPAAGVLTVKGLEKPVNLYRTPSQPALIDGNSLHDALFTLGYLQASEYSAQLLRLRQLAEGRLALTDGADALPLDRFMRAARLRVLAEQRYRQAPALLKGMFDVYANGINAAFQRLQLPLAHAWRAEDSALLFSLLDFAWSGNVQQELASVLLASHVPADQLAWLLPIYPDEPLAHEEIAALRTLPNAAALNEISSILKGLQTKEAASLWHFSSAQWAITPAASRSESVLLAGQIQPSALAWQPVLLRSPRYKAAGLMLPGLPLFLTGFNGQLAWSFSRSRGDRQDLRLERVRKQGAHYEYLLDGQWKPLREQVEYFEVNGQRAVRDVQYHTAQTVLLTAVPEQGEGVAVALPEQSAENERSLEAWLALSQAVTTGKAQEIMRDLHHPAVNVLFSDAKTLTWQVTGQYPNRRFGRGLVPTPGWDSAHFGWDGYATAMLLPYEQNPAQGWWVDAEQRSVPAGYGVQLSANWQGAARADYIGGVLSAQRKNDADTQRNLLENQTYALAKWVATQLSEPLFVAEMEAALARLSPQEQQQARQHWQQLRAVSTPNAAQLAQAHAFLARLTKHLFADELGEGAAWDALQQLTRLGYAAPVDHLAGRINSPFWDDRRTAAHEQRADIVIRSLLDMPNTATASASSTELSWQIDFARAVPFTVKEPNGMWQPLPTQVPASQANPLQLIPAAP